ncbi:hypothetical protein C8263_17720 [Deinococcus arcticus]|uniref:Uncharacterized protein n=2 Tax=Deinococcus arcticus TaxID=2136176 RepID=A0A2T3W3V6_9DEIO|nr:hypothetical protein C8263_17720 [Deinococcus arcticus]
MMGRMGSGLSSLVLAWSRHARGWARLSMKTKRRVSVYMCLGTVVVLAFTGLVIMASLGMGLLGGPAAMEVMWRELTGEPWALIVTGLMALCGVWQIWAWGSHLPVAPVSSVVFAGLLLMPWREGAPWVLLLLAPAMWLSVQAWRLGKRPGPA